MQQIRTFFFTWLLLFLANSWTPAFALSAYSNQELDRLEKEFRLQISQSHLVIRDPLAVQYINHLGRRLHKGQPGHPPYFFIVRSNEINAFAGPGGLIGINTALILATESESELASVMAHEMAHNAQHHLYTMLEHQKQMRIPMLASMLASIALGILNPVLGEGAMVATLTGVNQDQINFIRANEKEADRIGIGYLNKAGIDPQGMVRFFKKMQLNSRYYYTDNIPAILRTHPLDEARIAEAQNRIKQEKNRQNNVDPNYFLFRELLRVSVQPASPQIKRFYKLTCTQNTPLTACQFGKAIFLISQQKFNSARTLLTQLDQTIPDNLFIQLALAESEQKLTEKHRGLDRLKRLYEDYPDNYAVILTYGERLIECKKYQQATSVLLAGQRLFPTAIPLCQRLAQSENENGRKSYAYFTQAQCFLLEGRHHDAYFQLKQAKKYAHSDKYILLRINALMQDIKSMKIGND